MKSRSLRGAVACSLGLFVALGFVGCIPGLGAGHDCRPQGRYEVGKEGGYLPCCEGLVELPGWTAGEIQRPGEGEFHRACVLDMVPMHVYVCVRGMCADGICEVGEAAPCGCEEDCPSAKWGPRIAESDTVPINELRDAGATD